MLDFFAQPITGLSLHPRLESGYYTYMPPRHQRSAMTNIPINVGVDISIRPIEAWSFDLSILLGSRAYEEQFHHLGADYRVSHDYKDLTVRAQSTHRIDLRDGGFWEMSYGFVLSACATGGIAISTSKGQSGYLSETEPQAFGPITTVVRGWGESWPVRIGLIGTLLVVIPGEYYEPWPSQQVYNKPGLLSLGQTRGFLGLSFTLGIIQVPIRRRSAQTE
jgi:hypothetical protein